ncbi:MAG: hypothetical protein ACLFPL_00610 [Candidatus Nanoarchaeia archaeon]
MKQIIQMLVTIMIMSMMISSSYAYYGDANTKSQMVHTTLDNCEKQSVTLTFQKKEIEECEKFQAKEYSKPQSTKPSSNVRAAEVEHVEEETQQKEVTTIEQNVQFGDTYCEECENTTKVYEMSSSKPHTIEKDNSKESIVGSIITYVQDCFW